MQKKSCCLRKTKGNEYMKLKHKYIQMTGKSRNQPGLQKGLYIQDALKPSGITYVKIVLIIMLKISSLF